MGAGAEQIFRSVTVPAQNLKPILGIPVLLEPRVKSALIGTSEFQSVRFAIPVNMIHREEVGTRFPATRTSIAVRGEDFHFEPFPGYLRAEIPPTSTTPALIRLAARSK